MGNVKPGTKDGRETTERNIFFISVHRKKQGHGKLPTGHADFMVCQCAVKELLEPVEMIVLKKQTKKTYVFMYTWNTEPSLNKIVEMVLKYV